jgi:hypothetical protein
VDPFYVVISIGYCSNRNDLNRNLQADRVTCSTVEHLDEHSVLHHVVKVHATSKAEVDKKHWKHICAHELHKETVGAGKCGCECYSESFGFE